MDFEAHIARAMAFSRATFGPGERTKGVIDHIKKEMREILESPDEGLRSREWVDVLMLALDGLWRSLQAEGVKWHRIPSVIANLITWKQATNEQRDWPDWRAQDPERAIEHVRGKHD